MYTPPLRGIKSPIKITLPRKVDLPNPLEGVQRVFDLVQQLEQSQQIYEKKTEEVQRLTKKLQDLVNVHESKGEYFDQLLREYCEQIEIIYKHIASVKKGDKGDKGDSPILGKDYEAPRDGAPGKNANPEDVVPLVLAKLPKINQVDAESVKRSVLAALPFVQQKENEVPKFDLSVLEKFIEEHPKLKKLRQTIEEVDDRSRRYLHGGGDTVSAGSNITITTINGTKVISSSASGSVSFETPIGTVNGVNTVFTVTNTPLYIVVDGLQKFETTHYSYLAGTITITDGAPPTSYIRSAYA